MDCIDETVNTALYLILLNEKRPFRFHDLHDPVHRGYFIDGRWPHNSAAIQDKKTKEIFVIDSYYKANGRTPHIVLLDKWFAGWRPESSVP